MKRYREKVQSNIVKIRNLVQNNKVYIDFADFLLESDLNEVTRQEKLKFDSTLCDDLFGIDIKTLKTILKNGDYNQLMDYLIYALDNDYIMSACNSFEDDVMYIVLRYIKDNNTFGIYVKLRGIK